MGRGCERHTKIIQNMLQNKQTLHNVNKTHKKRNQNKQAKTKANSIQIIDKE